MFKKFKYITPLKKVLRGAWKAGAQPERMKQEL
jgi:hypothetical protein